MIAQALRGVRRRWRRYRERNDPDRRRFESLSPTPDDYRADRNLVLTGLARSGTSLVSSIISDQPNAYCANEMFYNPRTLARDLARVRMSLVAGLPVPNRYDRDGKLTTDTRRDGAQVRYRVAPGEFDRDCLVASKAHTLYLDELAHLTGVASRIVALVRDPLYTLGSWNTPAVQYIPEYHVAVDDLHPRWRDISFPTEDRVERQAVLWGRYARLIVDAARRGDLSVVCYEALSDPGIDLGRAFGLAGAPEIAPPENRNQRERFGAVDLDRIEAVVAAAGLDQLYEELTELGRGAHRDG